MVDLRLIIFFNYLIICGTDFQVDLVWVYYYYVIVILVILEEYHFCGAYFFSHIVFYDTNVSMYMSSLSLL